MRICDRHGIDDPKDVVETIMFEQSQDKYDLCFECMEEMRKVLQNREIGFVENVIRKVRGRPRKTELTQEN